MEGPVVRPKRRLPPARRGPIGNMFVALIVGVVLGGASTMLATYVVRDDLRRWPQLGALVCGDGLTVAIKPTRKGSRVACVDANGLEAGRGDFAALKMMAPAMIVFTGIGLYLVTRTGRRSTRA